MKKTIIVNVHFLTVSILLLLNIGAFAQLSTNGTIISTIANESPFLDAASNFNDKNHGKGLLFPRTDLTTFTLNIAHIDPLFGFLQSYFDGMIVYNTGSGISNANTSDSNVKLKNTTNVTPGFYYFSNPLGTTNESVVDGTWVRLTEMTDAVMSAINIAGGSAGDIFYQSSENTTAKLTKGDDGQILTLASGIPSWADAPATGITAVSGTANQITANTTSGSVSLSLPSTISGLTSVAATTFTGALSGNAATATMATNIAGGSAGDIFYQSSENTTAKLTKGDDGQILTLASGVPSWADAEGTATAGNGLSIDGTSGDVELGGTMDAATTINQDGNDLTFKTGNGELKVDGTFFSSGGVKSNLRAETSTDGIQWTLSDYIVIVEDVALTAKLTFPDPANYSSRILVILNATLGAIDKSPTASYWPLNAKTSINAGTSLTAISDGASWYVLSQY